MKEYPFINNTPKRRFELRLDDFNTAFIDYFVNPEGDIALTHTDVPREYENQGIGSQLALKSLEDIKAQNAKVIPRCGFIAAYIRRHPEWEPLVAQRHS
jgi:predicted GNAT family acetyltransferase